MTPNEAKEKWCPYAQVVGIIDRGCGIDKAVATQNRGIQTGSALLNCDCLADKCMAWRWEKNADGTQFYEVTDLGGGHTENVPHGYCGLAGKP